jgi:hypothetical protein
MLFDPARHEPLASTAWDESRAREVIGTLVRAFEDALGNGCTWPMHPLDALRPGPRCDAVDRLARLIRNRHALVDADLSAR